MWLNCQTTCAQLQEVGDGPSVGCETVLMWFTYSSLDWLIDYKLLLRWVVPESWRGLRWNSEIVSWIRSRGLLVYWDNNWWQTSFNTLGCSWSETADLSMRQWIQSLCNYLFGDIDCSQWLGTQQLVLECRHTGQVFLCKHLLVLPTQDFSFSQVEICECSFFSSLVWSSLMQLLTYCQKALLLALISGASFF